MKKLISALMALILVFALCGTTLAAPETLTDGVAGDSSGDALDKSVKIAKTIKAYNPETLAINAPTISYSYSIVGVDGGESGKTITDSSSITAVTKTPPLTMPTLTGTAANSIAWTTADQLNASSAGATDGTDNTKYLTVNFSGVTFSEAGVYRYQITETITAASYIAAGVTDGTASASGDSRTEVLYLDVYVRDAGAEETGKQIYGYVLASGNTDQPQDPSNKLDAFTTDEYKTSNVTVGKTLNGDSSKNNHPFPFHVSFANGTVTADVKLKRSINGAAAENMPSAMALSSTTDYQTIKHSGSVKYIGVPAGTTVSAYETNNVTGTTYNSSATVTGPGTKTNAAAKSITWGTAQGTYTAYSEQAYNSNLASVATTETPANCSIPFVNTLELISPTGYVARYAPYGLMLIAGIALLVIARKHRKHTDEE